MGELTSSELAGRAGVTEETLRALVDAGIVTPDALGGYRTADIARIRLVSGLVDAGMRLGRIGSAIADNRLSLDFVDLLMPDPVALVPVDDGSEPAFDYEEMMSPILGTRREHGEPIREDDLAILRIVARAVEMGTPPERVIRIVRAFSQAARKLVDLQRDFIDDVLLGPAIEETGSPVAALETTSEARYEYRELGRRLIMLIMGRETDDAVFRNLVELTELALETGGVTIPAPEDTIAFIDVSSYTALSERHGNTESARQAILLADFIHDLTGRHGARLVRSLGDGALVHAGSAAAGVRVALDAVMGAEEAGIWALHAGVNTGAMVRRDGDFYGTSVNIAARVADEASAGEVVVTGAVVDAYDDVDVTFERVGEATLKNVASPVALFRAVPRPTRPDA